MQTSLVVFEIALGPDTVLLHMNENQYRTKRVWESPRHNNADYELHVLLRGSCSLDVGDQTYVLKENHGVVIAPGQYHSPLQKSELEWFTASFSVTEGSLLSALKAAVPVCRIFPVAPDVQSLCRGIFYESAAGNAFRREMIQAQLTQLLLMSFRMLGMSVGGQSKTASVSSVERKRLIDLFFENHLADRAGEELLAAELHLSRRQLSRVLIDCYGMGYREKLISDRMDSAAWMLRCTDKRISEIASEVGYTSEAAFYQVFRARFEMTPTEYRSRHKK